MSKQISYAITKFHQPLEALVTDLPVPDEDNVLVKISHCGVCHSDVHFQDGSFDLGGGQKLEMKNSMPLPMTPGHEIVGTIAQLGPKANPELKVGQKVVLYPLDPCKECVHCTSGLDQVCAFQKFFGSHVSGGFSTHVIAKDIQAIPFEKIDPSLAAICCCSGITSYSAIKKLGPLTSEDKVLIIGAGGLGLMALQLFKAIYPEHPGPVVADIDPSKLEFAAKNGASEILNLKTDRKQISFYSQSSWIGGGFAGIIDFVGAGNTLSVAVPMANKGGKVVVVGLIGGKSEISVPYLPLRSISILGSYLGSLSEFKELIQIVKDGKITAPPVIIRPLSEASQSLQDLKEGKVLGRIVLRNDQTSAL